MAGRKKQFVDGHGDVREIVEWPKVTNGSHSTRIEYEDGRIELITDWKALARDVREAIAEYERNKLVEEAPYHPGYEGAAITTPKPKRTRKK